jgi:hypothetical protein
VTFGVRLKLRADDAGMLRELLARMPRPWKRSRSKKVDRVFTIAAGTSKLARRAALDSFEVDAKMFVAERAPRRVFVHAGVVGWRGRALLVPGSSMSGKSTLIAALVRAGARYYSDEYAVLDNRGRVHPYPRELALRDPATWRQQPHSISALGGRSGLRPLTVGAVIVTRYHKGRLWHPRKLTPGEGVLALLAHTVSAQRNPARAMATLRQAVAGAMLLESVRGDAAATARILLDMMPGPVSITDQSAS